MLSLLLLLLRQKVRPTILVHVFAQLQSKPLFRRIEALEYYTEQEAKLKSDFDSAKETALKTPLGIAFVTFESVNMAKEVYDSFQHSIFDVGFEPPESSSSRLLKIHQWKVGRPSRSHFAACDEITC